MTRIDHTAPFDLSTLSDEKLAAFERATQDRANNYQKLAALFQRTADLMRKEQRKRKRAQKAQAKEAA